MRRKVPSQLAVMENQVLIKESPLPDIDGDITTERPISIPLDCFGSDGNIQVRGMGGERFLQTLIVGVEDIKNRKQYFARIAKAFSFDFGRELSFGITSSCLVT